MNYACDILVVVRKYFAFEAEESGKCCHAAPRAISASDPQILF